VGTEYRAVHEYRERLRRPGCAAYLVVVAAADKGHVTIAVLDEDGLHRRQARGLWLRGTEGV
jgi:predicted nucleotidyltransferase